MRKYKDMNVGEIDMPALVFNPSYSILEFARDKNFLGVTTESGLKRGVMIGNLVVDSSGRMYKTVSAKKKRNYYPFWKFEFFDPFIYIELEVEKMKEMFDLLELKDKVLKNIKRNRDEWTNYGDVKEIAKIIQETRTHRELIETIGKYVHPVTEK